MIQRTLAYFYKLTNWLLWHLFYPGHLGQILYQHHRIKNWNPSNLRNMYFFPSEHISSISSSPEIINCCSQVLFDNKFSYFLLNCFEGKLFFSGYFYFIRKDIFIENIGKKSINSVQCGENLFCKYMHIKSFLI